jgi:hypothetical protein
VITISTDPTGNSAGTGPALDFDYSYGAAAADTLTFTAELNNGWTYNPSTQGAITNLVFSADKDLVSPLTISSVTAPAVLEQGGNYYVDFISGLPETGYQTISGSGLVAADFALYDFTTGTFNTADNPNFTSTGGPIEFGIGNRENGTVASPIVADAFFDKVTWDINTPEPSLLPLLGAGLLGVCALRRKRKSSGASN